MNHTKCLRTGMVWAITMGLAALAPAELRRESFDRDPGWDGFNNRPTAAPPAKIVQDFGHSTEDRQGRAPGAAGGVITPDGTAAYYAKPIPEKTFEDSFSASGTLVMEKGGGNLLLGFFNHGTLNEWRTPNSVVFRINGRGDIFHVHVEYATSRWRAGASVIGRVDREADRVHPVEVPGGGAHSWSIAYDRNGNSGNGSIRATFDDLSTECALDPGHRADGAVFDRFGLLNVVKSADNPGTVWIDDVIVDGQAEDFTRDPGWEGIRNRLAYESEEVRPRFNFGFSATNHAGGRSPGEIGGLFFRGDCRYPDKLACYGDRLDLLSLDKPLHASGRVVLLRGVSDSTALFGFYHAEHSLRVNESQASGTPGDFLGLCIEGPSREGFYVYPGYRVHGDGQSSGYGNSPPRILPDGRAHDWTLDYAPDPAGGDGKIIVSLDGDSVEIPLSKGHRAAGAHFNRFGFVTPWIDGNGQRLFFDDLEYTCKQ